MFVNNPSSLFSIFSIAKAAPDQLLVRYRTTCYSTLLRFPPILFYEHTADCCSLLLQGEGGGAGGAASPPLPGALVLVAPPAAFACQPWIPRRRAWPTRLQPLRLPSEHLRLFPFSYRRWSNLSACIRYGSLSRLVWGNGKVGKKD
jgi:hypothetical protein